MTLSDKQWRFLKDLSRLIIFIEKKGIKATGGELWRTPEMQEIYFGTGRSKTLNSKHLDRLAIDLNFFVMIDDEWCLTYEKKDIIPIGQYWEFLRPENKWGGHFRNFKDYPHFETR